MNSLLSDVIIANKALFKIGAKRITALDDGSSNAQVINEIYVASRQEILEEHPFSFAVNTVALAELDATLTDFTDGITIAYGLPSDFLYPYLINFPTAQIRIEMLRPPIVTTNTLAMLSDTPGLVMKYVFDNDDPTTYTAKFAEAFSCKLAYQACFKIAEAAQFAMAMKAAYDSALLSAMASDSKSSSPDQPIQNEWFVARLAGSGVVSGLPNGNIGFFPNPYNPDY